MLLCENLYSALEKKKSYKNNEFKISSLTLNEKLGLPDESYSVLDI